MMMDEDLHLQYKLFIPSICYLLFLSNNAWEDDTIIRISQTIASAGNLSYICHAKPKSVYEQRPFINPISNFTGIPNATVCFNCYTGPFHKVIILNPNTLYSLSQFNTTLGK